MRAISKARLHAKRVKDVNRPSFPYYAAAGRRSSASASGGLDEVAFERPDGRRRSSSGARPVEDVLDVVARGLHRDPERVGDVLVGLAGGERAQDLKLASTRARNACPAARRYVRRPRSPASRSPSGALRHAAGL